MKKYTILLIIFCVGVLLNAQTYRDTTVFLPVVSGTVGRPGDIEYISNRIIEHMENLGYLPVRILRSSTPYTLFASIARQIPTGERSTGAGPLPLNQSRMYVLSLELMDNKTGRKIISEDLIYSEPEEIANLLNLRFRPVPFTPDRPEPEPKPQPAAVVPAPVEEPKVEEPKKDPDEWRTKSWYIGAGAFWAPRIYKGDSESIHYVNFGYSISAEYHFLKLWPGNKIFEHLSLSTGADLIPEWVAVREKENYKDLLLEVPLTLNAVFRPSSYFMLTPYAGAHVNIPLFKKIKPPLVSWRAGFQYGIKAGPGLVVIDPWFSMDFGSSGITSKSDIKYQRYMIQIGVKYKYGFDDFKNFLWFIK